VELDSATTLPLALGMPQNICTKQSQTQGLLTLCQEKSDISQVNCSNKGYLIKVMEQQST
jgi:hypothetical protein